MTSSATYSPDAVRVVQFETVRVATLEHRGDPRLLGESVRKFIAWRRQNNLPPEWLPSSGEELRDFPMIFQRVRFPPEVAVQDSITDIFLPLRR